MNKIFWIGCGVAIGLAYLLVWPVPIEPVAWQAPKTNGYVGDYIKNDRLKALKFIDLLGESGPEDAALGKDGSLFVSVHSGKILMLDVESGKVESFANPGGRVLGIEVSSKGELFAADAYRGLLRIDETGDVQLLADKTEDGSPISYANDLDITQDGVIYFSDASVKFRPKAHGGTLPASLLDLMEHGGHGRVLKYDPATGKTGVIIEGRSFANGIALAKDETFLLIAETGTYSVLKYWLKGEKRGQIEVLIENLPGFPDNINRNPDGSFWLGLVSPRSPAVDLLSGLPFLRKIVLRLPAAFRPKPQRYGFALRFDGMGKIIETLQDPAGDYALVTGAVDVGKGKTIITSLTEGRLGYFLRP